MTKHLACIVRFVVHVIATCAFCKKLLWHILCIFCLESSINKVNSCTQSLCFCVCNFLCDFMCFLVGVVDDDNN